MRDINTIHWAWGANSNNTAEITVYTQEQAQAIQELLRILDIPYTYRWEPAPADDDDLPY